MTDEIKELYLEDQADRTDENILKWGKTLDIGSRDQRRLQRIVELISNNLEFSAEDCFHIAMLFQHGRTSSDYEKAQEYAKKSMDMNYEPAKWLYAASTDRLLLSQGAPTQHFGTQYKKDATTNSWYLVPVDPQTTDEERALYNVPSLKEALEKVDELNS